MNWDNFFADEAKKERFLKWALKKQVSNYEFNRTVGRTSQLLAGNLHGNGELAWFDLWEIERRVMLDDTDVLGSAKDTVFPIEVEENC